MGSDGGDDSDNGDSDGGDDYSSPQQHPTRSQRRRPPEPSEQSRQPAKQAAERPHRQFVVDVLDHLANGDRRYRIGDLRVAYGPDFLRRHALWLQQMYELVGEPLPKDLLDMLQDQPVTQPAVQPAGPAVAPAAAQPAGPQCRNASSLARVNPLAGDGQVSFVELGHSYTDHMTGQHPERSCTSVLGAGFEPVNFAALCKEYYCVWRKHYDNRKTSHKYYAILELDSVLSKGGSDAEAEAAVCASWQEKGDEACRLGTLLHLHCEYDLNSEVLTTYHLLVTSY